MKKTLNILVTVMIIMTHTTLIDAVELEDINVHGFISQGYLRTTENNFMAETKDGTLEFNEMGINFSTNLTNRLHLGVQFFAYDLGDEGNDEIGFDWAFADYHWRNELGLRIGTVKLVSGLYGERRQLDMLRTGVFLPFSVYVGPWWESVSSIKGATLYGEVPLGNFGDLMYNAQAGTGKFSEDSGPAKVTERQLSALNFDVTDMDSDYIYALGLEWTTPLQSFKTKATYLKVDGLLFRGDISMPSPPSIPPAAPVPEMVPEIPSSALNTCMDFEFVKLDSYVFSIEYRWRDAIFAAEYNAIDTETRWNWHLGQGWEKQPSITSEGWYLSASYRFTEWFELGLWYSEFYPDKDDKDGKKQAVNDFEAWQKTVTVSTRFDINEYWIVKLEASHNDGFGAYNIVDNPDDLEQNWFLYAVKVTYNF